MKLETKKPRRVIGLGETVLDIIFKGHQVQKAVPGGSTFNAMISLGRCGVNCTMATEIGDDKVADLIVSFLKDNGVDTDYVYRHKGTQSHISLAFLNERNDAEYSFYKMHGDLDMPMSNMPSINAGDIVLFGSFFAINPKLRRYVSTFLTKAKEAGATLYYDINFRAAHLKDLPEVMPYIEENIRLADVVRASTEDLSILNMELTPHDLQVVIITDADKPVRVLTSRLSPLTSHLSPLTSNQEFPVQKISTVSTIGAGDNFNAGFCYGLYRDEPLSECIAHALQFSAEVCQSLDNYISQPG